MVQNFNKTRWPSLTQFTYIFRYLSKSEDFIFRLSLFFLFAAAALMVGRYINRHWIPEPTIGGSYTEAVVGTPRFINPVLASSDLDLSLSDLVYNGLLRMDASGNYVNDLADKVEVSDAGKTYSITLKPGLTWQDDQNLTSDDVRFTIETIQNPNVGSPRYSDFRDVKIETPDNQKIIFKLDKANADFQNLLTLEIIPAHIWSDIPPAAMGITEFNLKPVGSGPFMFKEIRKKEKSGDITLMSLERFSNSSTPALLQELTFRFAQDSQAALDLVSSSQAQGLRLVSSDLFAKALKIRGIKEAYQSLPQTVGVFFNFKNKLFGDKNLRSALNLALDLNKIITETRPDAKPVNGPVLFGMPGGEEITNPRSQDLNKASELMLSSGWKKENDIYIKSKTQLEFNLTVPDIKEYADGASLIVEAWKNFGAKVELKKIDPSLLSKEVIKSRNFDALLYADRYDSSLDLYPFWHSTQSFDPGLNLTSYYNKELDQLLSQAQAQKPEAKAETNKKIQTIMVNELPAIFLYQPNVLLINSANLRSTIQPTLLTSGYHYLDAVNWYTQTDRVWKWNP
jgi:peptide/nickel transport system substrate-binding protein